MQTIGNSLTSCTPSKNVGSKLCDGLKKAGPKNLGPQSARKHGWPRFSWRPEAVISRRCRCRCRHEPEVCDVASLRLQL